MLHISSPKINNNIGQIKFLHKNTKNKSKANKIISGQSHLIACFYIIVFQLYLLMSSNWGLDTSIKWCM